jgi:hypothetical protein
MSLSKIEINRRAREQRRKKAAVRMALGIAPFKQITSISVDADDVRTEILECGHAIVWLSHSTHPKPPAMARRRCWKCLQSLPVGGRLLVEEKQPEPWSAEPGSEL